MSAWERRLEIVKLLYVRKFITMKKLANHFEVSRNTIKNDITELTYSYPIYTIKGNGGGVRILEEYKLEVKFMTPSQIKLLEKLSLKLTGEELVMMQEIIATYKNPVCNQ